MHMLQCMLHRRQFVYTKMNNCFKGFKFLHNGHVIFSYLSNVVHFYDINEKKSIAFDNVSSSNSTIVSLKEI